MNNENSKNINLLNQLILGYLTLLFVFFILFSIFNNFNSSFKWLNIKNQIGFLFIITILYLIIVLPLTTRELSIICDSNIPMGKIIKSFIVPLLFIYFFTMIVIYYTKNIWLKPFSNTIGVFITNIIFNDMYNELNNIFINRQSTRQQEGGEESQKSSSTLDNNTIHILKKILNEITSKDRESNINDKVDAIRTYNNNTNIKAHFSISFDDYPKVMKYVLMKDTTSLYIWSFLLGTVTIMITVNNIIRNSCNSPTVEDEEFQKYLKRELNS